MNSLRNLPQFLLVALSGVLLVNCQNDDYLIDSGVHDPNYEGNIMQYLESRPDFFKKTVEVIKLAGLEDVLSNETVTFFAPTDWSIEYSVNALSSYLYLNGGDSIRDYRQIKRKVWNEFMSLYIVPDKYLLNDIQQLDTTMVSTYGGQAYYSLAGRPMNMGVVYSDAGGVKYAGSRQILYSYINDFTTMDMKNAYVATCNIQPENGAVHVIRFTNHAFGFYPMTFVRRAIAEGITPLEDLE